LGRNIPNTTLQVWSALRLLHIASALRQPSFTVPSVPKNPAGFPLNWSHNREVKSEALREKPHAAAGKLGKRMTAGKLCSYRIHLLSFENDASKTNRHRIATVEVILEFSIARLLS
jgi:hypothetical protein